jgi:hypothetical protein
VLPVKPFEIPDHWPRAYGLDVGWNKTAAIWAARDNEAGVIYLYSEHYMGKEEPIVHTEAIKSRGAWIPGVIDPAARGRSQIDGRQLIQIYRECGLHLEEADNAVESGIYQVWQLMSSGKLKVFRSLGNWLSEFRLYQRDRDGKIVTQNDHLMDATRYLIMSGRDRMKAKPKAEAQIPEYSYDFAKNMGLSWSLRQVMALLSYRIRKKARRHGVRYSFLFMRANGNHLREIGRLIDSGTNRPVVDRVFRFESTNEAMAYVESGRAKGKVVVRVN